MSNNILQKIATERIKCHREYSNKQLEKIISSLSIPPDFAAPFKRDQVNIIAELKKASPSKGLIRPNFQPTELAKQLSIAGAAAISVITEPNYFLGNIEYLHNVSKIVSTPLLCKDFIIEEYQILEARANGASAILLIAALLDKTSFCNLHKLAKQLNMNVLCEAHTANEITFLADNGAEIIGVNARDLKTFVMHQDQLPNLLATIPNHCLKIAESGITCRQDIRLLRQAGANGFLIGESIMREANPSTKLKELFDYED